jgi:hypothetical protein
MGRNLYPKPPDSRREPRLIAAEPFAKQRSFQLRRSSPGSNAVYLDAVK